MVNSTLKATLDQRGRLLAEGDRVQGTRSRFIGERGLVVRAAGGTIINVRLESSGQTLASAANLWTKVDP